MSITQDRTPAPDLGRALLIVDDEPDVLESLRHLFHRRWKVLTADDGPQALRLMEAEPAAVVLSDQRMPGMTGDALLARVRESYPDATRLLFTGYADIQAVVKAVNQGGIFRYIMKPWDAEELDAVVGQAFAQHDLLVERRRLVEELQRANARLTAANLELAESGALKSAFLEVASHELNTPITIIQGMADLLKLIDPDRPETEREVVDQLGDSARHLAGLVRTMLKLVSSNDYRRTLYVEAVDLSKLLREVASQVGPFVRARHLTLDLDVPDGLGPVEVDAPKVRDAVLNLLTNAIKFTPDGGKIGLAARWVGQEVAVEVHDRGIGLEPRALAHLFQPFFTEFDPSRHSSGDFGFGKRGLGLGLSLVKTFVELHGGRVSASSRLGEGTTVTATFPRRARPAAGVRVGSMNEALATMAR